MNLKLIIINIVPLENPVVSQLVTKLLAFLEHEVHCRVDKSPPLDLLVSEMIPVDLLEPNFIKSFYALLLSTLRSCKLCLLCTFYN
jgi:hypothetical protein